MQASTSGLDEVRSGPVERVAQTHLGPDPEELTRRGLASFGASTTH